MRDAGFTVGNIDVLNVTRGKGYRYPFRNGRAKNAFIYVVKGLLCETFLGDEPEHLYVGAEEMIFVPRGALYYGTYLAEETEIKIVQFDLFGTTFPFYLTEPQKIVLPNAGELMESFFQPTSNPAGVHPFYYLSRIYDLLWQIDDCYYKLPSKFNKLQAALTEMSEHYDRNEMISHYADLCGMSEVNFRRLFREHTGKSPIEYRNDLRLKNARIKLQSGEYNVSEAAETSGFSNLSFFIRLYKKKYGYTPKKE